MIICIFEQLFTLSTLLYAWMQNECKRVEEEMVDDDVSAAAATHQQPTVSVDTRHLTHTSPAHSENSVNEDSQR